MSGPAPIGEPPAFDPVSFVVEATALVVFAGETDLKCLQWLRSGFQHCFVAVRRGDSWIVCDPLSHRTDLTVVSGVDSRELADWYEQRGLTVIATAVRQPPRRPTPLRPFTCVEAVKRVVGIHAAWISTPWQLYRCLRPEQDSKKSLTFTGL